MPAFSAATGNRVVVGQRKDDVMPDEETTNRARKDEQEGKSSSTQDGEFVREEASAIAVTSSK